MEKTVSSAFVDPKEFKKFLTNAICFISLGLAVASLGPILPFLADNVDVSIGQISFVFTAQNLGYLIGSVGGSWLFDRFKSHRLMILSIGLMVATGLLIPLMSWFYALLLVLFFFGLGLGILDVGGNLNLVWIFQSRVGPYMNALHFSFGVGAFLSPLIISNVMTWTGGWLMWAIWALVILYLPGLIGLISLKSPENIAKQGSKADRKTISYRMIVLIVLLFFLSVGIQIGFGGWIFTYVSDLQIADVTTAALMTSIFWGFLTLARLIAIPVSKKVSAAMMLLISSILTVLILGLILIWPTSIGMMWVGSAGLGFATATIFPNLMAFAEARMNMTGRLTGLFFLGSGLGMMLLPMLLGQVFEYLGGFEMMLTLFGVAVLGLVIMILLKRNRFQEKVRDAEA